MKPLRIVVAAAAATLLLAACADVGGITTPTRPNADGLRRSTDAAPDSTKRDNGGMYGSGGRITGTSQDGGAMLGSGGQTTAELTDGGEMFGGGG